MRAGRLQHRATFHRVSTAPDAYGQTAETNALLFSRWAAIKPLAGREYFAAQSENTSVTTEIRVRYDAGTKTLKPSDTVGHGGLVYDIESVIEPNLDHEELILMCEVRGR